MLYWIFIIGVFIYNIKFRLRTSFIQRVPDKSSFLKFIAIVRPWYELIAFNLDFFFWSPLFKKTSYLGSFDFLKFFKSDFFKKLRKKKVDDEQNKEKQNKEKQNKEKQNKEKQNKEN